MSNSIFANTVILQRYQAIKKQPFSFPKELFHSSSFASAQPSVSRKWRSLTRGHAGLGGFVLVWLVHRIGLGWMIPFLFCAVERGATAPSGRLPHIPLTASGRKNGMHAGCMRRKMDSAGKLHTLRTIWKRLEAHTQKAPENQRRKAAYTAVYPAFHPQKSGIVRLAKILHFWPYFKKPNNI